MDRRADVVHETRVGEFGGPEPTPDGGPCFEHEHFPSRAGERDRADEPVRSGAHDDGVVFRCAHRGLLRVTMTVALSLVRDTRAITRPGRSLRSRPRSPDAKAPGDRSPVVMS